MASNRKLWDHDLSAQKFSHSVDTAGDETKARKNTKRVKNLHPNHTKIKTHENSHQSIIFNIRKPSISTKTEESGEEASPAKL